MESRKRSGRKSRQAPQSSETNERMNPSGQVEQGDPGRRQQSGDESFERQAREEERRQQQAGQDGAQRQQGDERQPGLQQHGEESTRRIP